MDIVSLELKRINPDQNIFSDHMEQTPSLFTLWFGSYTPNFKCYLCARM